MRCLARSCNFGELLGRQTGLGALPGVVTRAAVGPRPAVAGGAGTSIAVEVTTPGAGALIAVGPRPAVAGGAWTSVTRGSSVVVPGRARSTIAVVAKVTVAPRALLPIMTRGCQRDLGSRLSLWSGAAQRRARSRQDAGGLGAHAQDAAAAGRQDLEIELVEAHAELFSGPA